jgi:hypothetical protein
MQACESGSMCANGLIADDSGIYCETAANPDESSWGYYCPPDDVVNGTHVGSCLGDLYSVAFVENSEQRRPFGSAWRAVRWGRAPERSARETAVRFVGTIT